MMASKGAIVPVGKVMKMPASKFDPGLHLGGGRLLHGAQRADAELPVQQLDHGAPLQQGRLPRPPAWTRTNRPPPGRRWRGRRQAEGQGGHKCPFTTSWQAGRSWRASPPGTTRCSPRKNNGFGGTRRAAGLQQPAARAPHREPGQHGQAGPVPLPGRGNNRRRAVRFGRMRDDPARRRPTRASSERQVRLGIAPCPTTLTCRARRRTP